MHDTSSKQRQSELISADELAALIKARADVVILDIRFQPDRPDGRPEYRAAHIPGAIYVDLQTELAGEVRGYSGRRPLPEVRDLQRDARRWGIRADSTVVVVDDNRGLSAGRAWWTLRWAGVPTVRLLDGGLEAWKRAGLETTTLISLPDPGDVVLTGGRLPVLSANEAAAIARSSILIDSRGWDAYLGGPVAPGQAPEGHIPGAHSAPTTGNLGPEGEFLSAQALRARFAELGIDGTRPVGVYCGGGVAASHQIAALTSIGVEAALFPGSWSAWSSDPSRPVATGAAPG